MVQTKPVASFVAGCLGHIFGITVAQVILEHPYRGVTGPIPAVQIGHPAGVGEPFVPSPLIFIGRDQHA